MKVSYVPSTDYGNFSLDRPESQSVPFGTIYCQDIITKYIEGHAHCTQKIYLLNMHPYYMFINDTNKMMFNVNMGIPKGVTILNWKLAPPGFKLVFEQERIK
jgi:hypothetical protein